MVSFMIFTAPPENVWINPCIRLFLSSDSFPLNFFYVFLFLLIRATSPFDFVNGIIFHEDKKS